MLTVGIRELKNRLTHYLRLTKNGERIIVTDRGTPIAVLHELSQVEVDASPEERLAGACAEGMIRLPERDAAIDLATKAVAHKGPPSSEILIRDRR